MKAALGCLFWAGAIIVGLGAILKIAMFDIAVVQHNSMAPTILEGERVLVYKRGTPKINKIAVCEHPEQEGLILGRVAATEGVQIQEDERALFLNDQRVEFDKKGGTNFYDVGNGSEQSLFWGEEYLVHDSPHLMFLPKEGPQRVNRTVVPQGEVYLLGDNRTFYGHDSRGFGTVGTATCVGVVVMRITPSDWLNEPLEHGHFDLLR